MYVCEEEIVSVCEGLFNTVRGVCVSVCGEERRLLSERKRASVWYFCQQSDISRQGVCTCMCA